MMPKETPEVLLSTEELMQRWVLCGVTIQRVRPNQKGAKQSYEEVACPRDSLRFRAIAF